MRRVMLAAAAGVAALLPFPASAGPAGNMEVVVVPWTYSGSPVHVPHGETLTFTNLDPLSAEGHSLTHAVRPGSESFQSPIVPAGTSAPVARVEKLERGTYEFTCRVHPFMAGTLIID
jgi:plastocyanin